MSPKLEAAKNKKKIKKSINPQSSSGILTFSVENLLAV